MQVFQSVLYMLLFKAFCIAIIVHMMELDLNKMSTKHEAAIQKRKTHSIRLDIFRIRISKEYTLPSTR